MYTVVARHMLYHYNEHIHFISMTSLAMFHVSWFKRYLDIFLLQNITNSITGYCKYRYYRSTGNQRGTTVINLIIFRQRE